MLLCELYSFDMESGDLTGTLNEKLLCFKICGLVHCLASYLHQHWTMHLIS